MLNLSRRVGESILIGDDIVVTILAVKGKQVRIGLSAPDGISIMREEIAPRLTVVRTDRPVEPANSPTLHGVLHGTTDGAIEGK